MRPRAWAWLAGAVVAALGATTFVTPAQSMPVRAFGAPISIAPPVVDVYGPSMAVLPDGTVGVAWTSTLNTVRMAIRRPGTNTFVTLTPLTLTDSIVTDGPSAS